MNKVFATFMFLLCGGINTVLAAESQNTNVAARQLADQLQVLIDDANVGRYSDAESKEYVQRAQKLSADVARTLLFGFFAEKVLMSYWDNVLVQMRDVSVSTGRQLKSKTFEGDIFTYYYYWLDRGNLDAPECGVDYAKKQACTYPEGFEEFSLIVKEAQSADPQRWGLSLDVWWDNREQNKTNFISYSANMNGNGIVDDGKNMYGVWGGVIIAGHEYDYDKYYAARNQYNRDVREGMFVKAPVEELNGLGVEGWEMDQSRIWGSQITEYTLPSAEFSEVISVEALDLSVGRNAL